jgi:hypothetical protein
MRIRRKAKNRTIPLTEPAMEALAKQRERFRLKFGREPGPNDRVFFDPNAAEPREMNPAEVASAMVRAMEKAGIDPAKIYAYAKTGMIVSEENSDNWSEEDLAEWRGAIDEYRVKQPPDEPPSSPPLEHC